MKYPESLKKGDTIGICAPSGGVTNEVDKKRLDEAIKNLKNMGYKIIETASVRKDEKGRSNTGKKRAQEFMELLENEEVKLIIFANGGDYLLEMIDHLDLEKIKKLKPKWMQGYSDITGLEFIFNTILEMPSIYCDNVKSYAMKPLYKNLTDSLKIASGKFLKQESFEKCEEVIENIEESFAKDEENKKENINVGYSLTKQTKWININNESKIEIEGRMIGGCLDVIQRIVGTKYDNIVNYINKYKKDGIIWYLESFNTSSAELTRILWQFKNSGFFDNAQGIIFGRPLFFKKEYETTFIEAITQALDDIQIPIICNADIGHVAPQMAIVNGGIMKIISKNGKGDIYYDIGQQN